MTISKVFSQSEESSEPYSFAIQTLTPFSSESARLDALNSAWTHTETRSFRDLILLCLSCKLEDSDLTIKEAITLKACSDALNGDPKAREWIERVSEDFQNPRKEEDSLVLSNLLNPENARYLPNNNEYAEESADSFFQSEELTSPDLKPQDYSDKKSKYARKTTLAKDIINALDKPIAPNSEISLREYISRKCIAKLLSGSPCDMKNALKLVSEEEANDLEPITKTKNIRIHWARSEEEVEQIKNSSIILDAKRKSAKKRKKIF